MDQEEGGNNQIDSNIIVIVADDDFPCSDERLKVFRAKRQNVTFHSLAPKTNANKAAN